MAGQRRSYGVVLLAVLTASCGGESPPSLPSPPPTATPAPLVWLDNPEAARAAAGERPLLVVVTNDWCVWCAALEMETLPDPAVAAAAAGRVVPLRVVAEGPGEVLGGIPVEDLPTLLLVGADGEELARLEGMVSPELTATWLREMLEAEIPS